MLVVVADILTRSIRETDGIVGRIGGEEFALLVIHAQMSDVMALAAGSHPPEYQKRRH